MNKWYNWHNIANHSKIKYISLHISLQLSKQWDLVEQVHIDQPSTPCLTALKGWGIFTHFKSSQICSPDCCVDCVLPKGMFGYYLTKGPLSWSPLSPSLQKWWWASATEELCYWSHPRRNLTNGRKSGRGLENCLGSAIKYLVQWNKSLLLVINRGIGRPTLSADICVFYVYRPFCFGNFFFGKIYRHHHPHHHDLQTINVNFLKRDLTFVIIIVNFLM